MGSAFVTINLLDLRSRPERQSELVNQVLFGDIVSIRGRSRKGFTKIEKRDGYVGWSDERFLRPISRHELRAWERHGEMVIVRWKAAVYDSDGNRAAPFFIYYGARVRVLSRRENRLTVILPDSSRVFLKAGAARPIENRQEAAVSGQQLVKEARRFLGVPYVWGGISPAGMDCSGFLQTVAGRFGLSLPRDTKDQIRFGRAVPRNQIRAGDLVFFHRHVGLALSRRRIIHSSAGGGGVRINSLQAGDEDYRPDLDKGFKSARRIV